MKAKKSAAEHNREHPLSGGKDRGTKVPRSNQPIQKQPVEKIGSRQEVDDPGLHVTGEPKKQ